MISEELKVIVDKLKEQGKMDFLPETSEEKVTSFEKENSVKLPEKYKEWLLFSDGGELFLPAGIQLYGVEHKPLIDVNPYLADIEQQAQTMFSQLVKSLAEKENVTEKLKADNSMLWVRKMNNIRNRAMEIVNSEVIFV